MQNLYSWLFYIGLTGTLMLLGLEVIPPLRSWRRWATAVLLTLIAFIWLALPLEGRWLFSSWSPSAVLGGEFILDVSPGIWWLGLTLNLAFAGMAWVGVVDRGGGSRERAVLSGALILPILMATWLALTGGSLLTTLAAWAIFDLLWGAATLISGGDGERVTFGWLLQGAASLILWAVSLLLQREGDSSLWWLMWPSPAVSTLLLVATLLRMSVYPFHIGFPHNVDVQGPLALVSSMGPILGVGLLYRVLMLPGNGDLPQWVLVVGVFSLIWGGFRAWSEKESGAVLWGIYALLGGIVAGAVTAMDAEVVLGALAVWFAGWVLLLLSRGRDRKAIGWAWPGGLALLFLIGLPPSPLGTLYRSALATTGWIWKVLLVIGWTMTAAALFKGGSRPAVGSVTPPRAWQRVGLVAGLFFPMMGLVGAAVPGHEIFFSWLGFLLWGFALVAAASLVRLGSPTRRWFQQGSALWDSLDLQWLYRALWRGLENLLSVVRVAADLVEGSGALLWSLLILLIILLVTVNRWTP
ncbi:MAG: hypothetical protein ACP5GX_06065 [Anaerolineae bacterium]